MFQIDTVILVVVFNGFQMCFSFLNVVSSCTYEQKCIMSTKKATPLPYFFQHFYI